MEMLRKGRSVTESCLGVGFISLGSFSGRFKQLTGTTTSDYEREQQKRNNGMTHYPLKFIPGCYADRRTNVRIENLKKQESKTMPTLSKIIVTKIRSE